MTEVEHGSRRTQSDDRAAALALIAAAAGIVLAMAHHPTGTHSGGPGGFVHGAMILLLAATTFGFATFVLRRGVARPAILAGATAYAISVFSHVGAATINGFVVPALAARGDAAVSHDIFLFAWETNQALAGLGVFATGAAFLLWSADLMRGSGRDNQAVAALGLLAGVAPAALLGTGLMQMNVAGAFATYATHSAWAALVGVQLWRGRIRPG